LRKGALNLIAGQLAAAASLVALWAAGSHAGLIDPDLLPPAEVVARQIVVVLVRP
jgi:ABC-type nitrate/sulfonate/bicarbonate transport system permease component